MNILCTITRRLFNKLGFLQKEIMANKQNKTKQVKLTYKLLYKSMHFFDSIYHTLCSVVKIISESKFNLNINHGMPT